MYDRVEKPKFESRTVGNSIPKKISFPESGFKNNSFSFQSKTFPIAAIQRSSLVIQRGINDLSETKKYDSYIYGITDNLSSNSDTVIYIGQTSQELFDRFHQHTTDSREEDQPWHINNYSYDEYDAKKWRFFYEEKENCKHFTPLEITAAEQFWFEYYNGLSGKLKNRQQPLRKITFCSYRDTYPGSFRGETIGFPSDKWEPKQ
jgi:hypothetical protein